MNNTAERIEQAPTPLEAVLHRLGGQSGFPALASTITDINRIVASDSDSVAKLTRTILRDVSLTNKLVQVVNSATYGQFRGHIHTISKAVLILGFDTVRNAAMSLAMLEFSRGKAQQSLMQDEIVGAFFAGVVAKPLCEQLGLRNSEEGVICTMFQNLGKLLAIFFLYEESHQVRVLMQGGLSEAQASEQVLGISYSNLGMGIAKHWNFPERLILGMQHIAARDIIAPRSDTDRLQIAANLANELCATALQTAEAQKDSALTTLARRYASALKLSTAQLNAALEMGLQEIVQRAPLLQLAINNSTTLNTIRTWTGEGQAQPDAQEGTDTDVLLQNVAALEAAPDDAASQPPEQILSCGIRDVTETLVSDFALNDILQMVLETMYRGMGFSRTLIFIRDAKLNTMRARFGFGDNIERIMPKCSFPLTFTADVFHIALDKGVDIVIEDAQAANIATRIPTWHQQAMAVKSFLLLPVAVKNKSIGLLYADSTQPGLKISAQQLGLLRTLRSQVIIAFKQKM